MRPGLQPVFLFVTPLAIKLITIGTVTAGLPGAGLISYTFGFSITLSVYNGTVLLTVVPIPPEMVPTREWDIQEAR